MAAAINSDFKQRIREALLADPQLARLVGDAIVTDSHQLRPGPYIRVAEAPVTDWATNSQLAGERTLTLEIWPGSGDPSLATRLLATTHNALQKAGMVAGKRSIQLHPEYSGSRRMPDSREIHCILRYHAVGKADAA